MLVTGSNCRELGGKIAELSSLSLSEVEVKKFPDNETYVRIPAGVKEKNIYYLQTFFPNQNDALIEAFLTIDALAEQGASVTPVFPYFPYCKQDKIFLQGEALSVRTIFKIFNSLGVQQAFFINSHFLKKEGLSERYGIKCNNINVAPILLKHISNIHKDILVVLPGQGARNLIEGTNFSAIHFETKRGEEYKLREGKTFREVEVTGDLSDAEGRIVVVLDDMISTGGTMAKTCAALRKGAKKVIAAAVHGLFVGDAVKKLNESANEIITTDTVLTEFSKVSVAEEIAKIVK